MPSIDGRAPLEQIPEEVRTRYRLGALLGEGACGAVFSGQVPSTGKRVAVKVLHEHHARHHAERIVREAKFLARIAHPNVVKVYDASVADEQPYLVMELLEGGALSERLATRPPALGEALAIAAACVDALAACHEQGVLHRDLKPSNILFGADGAPKLADFGMAFGQDAGGTRLTETGYVVGTPLYMAPEVLVGAAPSVASDLYSMGLIVYEMVAGRRPYLATRLDEFLAQRLSGDHVALDAVVPGVPAELTRLVSGLLAAKADARPAGAAGVAAELAAIAARLPADDAPRHAHKIARTPQPAHGVAPADPAAQRRSAGWVPGLAALLLSVGFAAGLAAGRWPRAPGREGSPGGSAAARAPALDPVPGAPSPSGAAAPPARGESALLLDRADFFLGTNRPALALQTLGERGVHVEPGARAMLLVGHVYLALYRGADADAMYRSALGHAAGPAVWLVEARLALARLRISRGELELAHPLIEEALRMTEADAREPTMMRHRVRAHVLLGELARIEKRWADAGKAFRTAAQLGDALPSAQTAHDFNLMDRGFWKSCALRELDGRDQPSGISPQGVTDGALNLLTH